MRLIISIGLILLGVAINFLDWSQNGPFKNWINVVTVGLGVLGLVLEVYDKRQSQRKERDGIRRLERTENSLKEYKKDFSGDKETDAYFRQISKLEQESRFKEAILVLKTLSEKRLDKSTQAVVVFKLARNYHELSDHLTAISHYNKALQLANGLPSASEAIRLKASVNFNLGWLESVRGNPEKSISHFENTHELIFKILKDNGDTKMLQELANAYNGIAVGLLPELFVNRAFSLLEKAIVIFKHIGDLVGEAQVLCNFGRHYRDKRDDKHALIYFESAQVFAEQANHKPMMADVYALIGNVYENTDQLELAEKFQRMALALYKELKEGISESHCLNSLGLIAFKRGLYAKALEFHTEALAKASEFGVANEIGSSHAAIGNCQIALGDLKSAKSSIDIAIKLHEKVGSVLGLAFDYGYLAEYHYRSGRRDACMENLRIALKYYETLDHQPGVARTLQLINGLP